MIAIEEDGSVTFTVAAPEATSVDLVGAFDGWHERRIPMAREADGPWTVRLHVPPGAHLFRYQVDGLHWRLDPEAHGTCPGADGTPKSRVWRPPLRLEPDVLAA